jgi:hypothetical protein
VSGWSLSATGSRLSSYLRCPAAKVSALLGACGTLPRRRATIRQTFRERGQRVIQIPKAREHLVRLRRQRLSAGFRSGKACFELRERGGHGAKVWRRHSNSGRVTERLPRY